MPDTSKLGRIAPAKEISQRFDLKSGTDMKIIASIPSSANVFETSKTILEHEEDPIHWNIDITDADVNGEEKLPPLPIDEIKARLLELDSGIRLQALNLNNALKTILGGIVVGTVQVDGKFDVLRTINSSQINNETLLGDFPYQTNNEQVSVTTSEKTVGQLTGNFAIYGGFSIDTSNESFYHFETTLKDYGPVKIIEKSDWDLNKALNNDMRKDLANILIKHPGAKILYINRVWVARQAVTKMKRAKSMTVGSSANASSIVTAKAAYTFDDVQSTDRDYSNQTLVFWGEERDVNIEAPAGGESGKTQNFTLEKFHEQSPKPQNRTDIKLIVGKAKNKKVSIPSEVLKAFLN